MRGKAAGAGWGRAHGQPWTGGWASFRGARALGYRPRPDMVRSAFS